MNLIDRVPKGAATCVTRLETLHYEKHAESIEEKNMKIAELEAYVNREEATYEGFEEIHTPEPLPNHYNCWPCMLRYDNYFEHLKSLNHI